MAGLSSPNTKTGKSQIKATKLLSRCWQLPHITKTCSIHSPKISIQTVSFLFLLLMHISVTYVNIMHSTPSVMNSAARRCSHTYTGNSLEIQKKLGYIIFWEKSKILKKNQKSRKIWEKFFLEKSTFSKKFQKSKKTNLENQHFQKKLKNQKKNLGVKIFFWRNPDFLRNSKNLGISRHKENSL